ncbi:hypothetical protein [Thermococcus stetteri]|uniref:hypothetical protein n=1 Tax=Thermococcus stetteri TaxID=49900 RepID=UPI001AE9FAA7|nr:hypothetical protein [Thermococcus stetteri]MBP1912329.1 hypothetical protein [Thermococcus stetteri]
MGVRKKFLGILQRGRPKRYVMYTQVKCEALSMCASKLETIFKTVGVEFIRLLEPDSETLASYSERLYSGKSVEIIELTDGMSRMFYLVSPLDPVRPEGELKPEFTLFFNVKSREALEALLRVIGGKRISGRRYKHRSGISFAISFLGSFLFSSLLNTKNYFLQSLLLLVLTLLIYLVLDFFFFNKPRPSVRGTVLGRLTPDEESNLF